MALEQAKQALSTETGSVWAQNVAAHSLVQGLAAGPIGIGSGAVTGTLYTGAQLGLRWACKNSLPDNNLCNFLVKGAEVALIASGAGVATAIVQPAQWAVTIGVSIIGTIGSQFVTDHYEKQLDSRYVPEESVLRWFGKPVVRMASGGLITWGVGMLARHAQSSDVEKHFEQGRNRRQAPCDDTPNLPDINGTDNPAPSSSSGLCPPPQKSSVNIPVTIGVSVSVGLIVLGVGTCVCGIRIKNNRSANRAIAALFKKCQEANLDHTEEDVKKAIAEHGNQAEAKLIPQKLKKQTA